MSSGIRRGRRRASPPVVVVEEMNTDSALIAEHPHDALRGYPVVVALQVEWGDQDSFGHVNNTVFLKWCETGRVAYLERAGMWRLIETQGKGPILVSISCNYRRQVTFPDTVQVGSRVTKIGNSSFRMEHAIVSLTQDAVAAESDSTMVFLEYEQNNPLRVPDDMREAFGRIEGRSFA